MAANINVITQDKATCVEFIQINRLTSSPFFHPSLYSRLSDTGPLNSACHLIFRCDDTTIGTCFYNKQSVHGLPGLEKALLNQTGIQTIDQLWIEYNDILSAPSFKAKNKSAYIQHLSDAKIAQAHISMTTDLSEWVEVATRAGWSLEAEKVLGFRKGLKDTSCLEALLKTLSTNTRSKIKRSIKKLTSEWGEPTLETAKDVVSQSQFLDALATCHKARWGATPEGSGFSNPYFYETIKALLLKEPEFARIHRLAFGDKTIGHVINFTLGQTVYFYCSGIEHAIASNHIKPGYVMHCYLMVEYNRLGFHTYDFMGGESQYKKSLSDEVVDFYNLTLTAPSLKGRLLRALTALKRRFKQ